jgi:hypothetical protein
MPDRIEFLGARAHDTLTSAVRPHGIKAFLIHEGRHHEASVPLMSGRVLWSGPKTWRAGHRLPATVLSGRSHSTNRKGVGECLDSFDALGRHPGCHSRRK